MKNIGEAAYWTSTNETDTVSNINIKKDRDEIDIGLDNLAAGLDIILAKLELIN